MSEMLIYTTPEKKTAIEVRLIDDTLWLSQQQMAELFATDRTSVNRHIGNVFRTGELSRKGTCAKWSQVRTEGKRVVQRDVDFYSLDVIISVGYRVNSRRGTQFRQWATQRLKDHLVKGFSINEKRIAETPSYVSDLKQALRLVETARKQRPLAVREMSGILDILQRYGAALETVERYDSNTLKIKKQTQNLRFIPDSDEMIGVAQELRKGLKASELFGKERPGALAKLLRENRNALEAQGSEIFIATMLYSIVKNQPFFDGNKRIGAFVFIWMLDRNGRRLDDNGQPKLNANGLAALTLLVDQSVEDDREQVIKLIADMIKD